MYIYIYTYIYMDRYWHDNTIIIFLAHDQNGCNLMSTVMVLV